MRGASQESARAGGAPTRPSIAKTSAARRRSSFWLATIVASRGTRVASGQRAARRGQRGYDRDAIWRAKKREVVMIGVIVWLDELVGYPDESSTYTPHVPYTCPEGSAAPPRADAANRTVPCW